MLDIDQEMSIISFTDDSISDDEIYKSGSSYSTSSISSESFLNQRQMNSAEILEENLDLETLKLDLTNTNTLKLYKINQDLQNINKHVDFLIYKLVCLFNFLLSKKGKQQFFIK